MAAICLGLNVLTNTELTLQNAWKLRLYKGEHQSTSKKIKHFLRLENKVNKNISSYFETLRYL